METIAENEQAGVKAAETERRGGGGWLEGGEGIWDGMGGGGSAIFASFTPIGQTCQLKR